MARQVSQRSKKLGLPPGTLVHVGEKKTQTVSVTLFNFEEKTYTERCFTGPELPGDFPSPSGVSWLDVSGIHEVEVIRKIGEKLCVHPLVLEDIANTHQRPKVEIHGDYLYAVLRMAQKLPGEEGIEFEQMSFLLGRGWLVTFQERPGDIFEPVRERIRQGQGRVRREGADFLMHMLLDMIVDHYFLVIEGLSDEMETLEDELFRKPDSRTLADIHRIRSDSSMIRRAAWPLREMIQTLQRSESELVSQRLHPYLTDLYDHVLQVVDTVEVQRETLAGYADIYLSSLSIRMNEIMQVLTIIATIFIPLTFIVGVYGMNFHYMPELTWKYGYFMVWVVMLATSAGMVVWFRRKRWF
jgi:magnesium transporter